jgi:hypothetical protein
MHHKSIRLGATLCFFLISAASPVWPQKVTMPPSSRENERISFAINLVRAINTAELHFKENHQVFANWETLFGNGDFSENGTKWAPKEFPTVAHALYGNSPEIAPGWRLRLNLSNNGKSYDLLLEDLNDPKCRYAAVSDERGIIRQSKAIDCAL